MHKDLRADRPSDTFTDLNKKFLSATLDPIIKSRCSRKDVSIMAEELLRQEAQSDIPRR